jgi:predicted transcriptional regulator
MDPSDIELGDEPIELERRSRAGVVVSVRLSPDEADRLQDIAERRQTTLSRVAREAIKTYLTHGPVKQPAASPWTGASSFGQLVLSYSGFGSTVRTSGPRKRTSGLKTLVTTEEKLVTSGSPRPS